MTRRVPPGQAIVGGMAIGEIIPVCPPGNEAVTPSTACTLCLPGFYSSAGIGRCTRCPLSNGFNTTTLMPGSTSAADCNGAPALRALRCY